MERFEPTKHHSSSSTSSLEYGFGAGVVTSSSTPTHHSHHQILPSHHQVIQSATTAVPYSHVYSYAYYEPGAAKCHTNVPQRDLASGNSSLEIPVATSKISPRYSIRSLLAKSFRTKSNNDAYTSPSPCAKGYDERHSYTTRYGTTENLYEEVNDHKIRKVLSDNRIPHSNVKEELRRVQHNHFRVLDQLNLSLEALIMPETQLDSSGNQQKNNSDHAKSTAEIAMSPHITSAVNSNPASSSLNSAVHLKFQRTQRGGLLGGAASLSSTTVSPSHQRTFTHESIQNLSSALPSIEHTSCINPEFDEGDLDSGFSGSGSSSGASYNESVRYYKTGPTTSRNHSHAHLPQSHHSQTHHHIQQPLIHHTQINQSQIHSNAITRNIQSCSKSLSKSSMALSEDQGIGVLTPSSTGCGTASPTSNSGLLPLFNYTQRCSDPPRASMKSSSASPTTGAKPKKNFWKLKP